MPGFPCPVHSSLVPQPNPEDGSQKSSQDSGNEWGFSEQEREQPEKVINRFYDPNEPVYIPPQKRDSLPTRMLLGAVELPFNVAAYLKIVAGAFLR